jgi:hypothetical protein
VDFLTFSLRHAPGIAEGRYPIILANGALNSALKSEGREISTPLYLLFFIFPPRPQHEKILALGLI